LVAAGLFYLLLTVPLTHLVNYIDARLRRGSPAADSDEPATVVGSTLGQEMT
jgi:polar amino acid transport system substrate-binding protein